MARLRISGETGQAVTSVSSLSERIAALAAQVAATNREIVEGATTAVAGTARMTESYEALLVAVRAEATETVRAQKLKVDAYRTELTAIREVTATYARGSAERQALVKREIELQHALAAATGEAAGATGLAAASAARSRAGHGRSAALRNEEGIVKGAVSRGLGLGGALAGPGFILGAGATIEIKAAMDAVKSMQVSLVLLRQSVRTAGISWNEYGEQMLKVVRRQEELSGFTRNQLRESMASLVTVTKNPAESMRLLGIATDLARKRHIDLDAATRILVRTWATGGRGLARLGIEVPKVTTHMDALRNAHIKVTDANREQVTKLRHTATEMDKVASRTAALDEIQKRYGGAAEAYMGTAAGATDKLHNSIEELQISVGRALLPQISHLADGIAAWIEKQQKAGTLQKTINGYIEQAGEVAHTFWEALKLLHSIVSPLVSALGGLNGVIKTFIGYMVAKRVLAMAEALTVLRAGITGVGTAAAVASGEAKLGGLLTKLGLLARIGPISIPIILAYSWRGDISMKNAFGDKKGLMQAHPELFPAGAAFGNDAVTGDPNTALTGQKGGAKSQSQLSAERHGVTISAGADRRGVSTKAHVITFVERVAQIVGRPLRISTGTNHNEHVKGSSNVSDHWAGNAADIPAKGAALTQLGQAALIAAGMDPQKAVKETGGAYHVNGVNILFNTDIGGNHYNHLHVGLKSLPLGFETTDDIHVVAPGKVTTTESAYEESLASAQSTGAKGGKAAKPLRGMPTPGPGGGSVDKLAAKKGFRTMYGQTLVNYIATKAKSLGLDPAAVLAVASVEGGFNGKVGDNGTSFGPFQLHAGGALPNNVWSQGPIYARAWANSPQGLDYALDKIASVAGGQRGGGAVASIVSGFEHPADVAGEITKAQGRLGATAFKIGRVQGEIPGASAIRDRIKDQAKVLRDLIRNALAPDGGENIESLFGRIGGARQRLAAIDEPLSAANNAIVAKLEALRKKLNAMLSGGVVSQSAINAVKAQMKELGTALARGLDEQAIRGEHTFNRVLGHIRQQFARRQQARLDEFDKQTQAQVNAMRKNFEAQMRAFDAETERGLRRFEVGETPAEAALRQFQEQRQAESDQKALADAFASGDPEQIRQATLDQQEKMLTKAAQQSREAQDQMTRTQQDAYQTDRAMQRDALQEREDALEQSYQDQRLIARTALEDIIADETDKFEEDIEVWQSWLNERAQRLDEFYQLVKDKYGIGPGNQNVGGSMGRIEEGLFDEIVRGRRGREQMASGGTLRNNRLIGRGDLISASLSAGETVIDESLTRKLEEMVSRGGTGGGVQVIIPGAFLLGRDRDVARKIAETAAPEIERIIGYTPTL